MSDGKGSEKAFVALPTDVLFLIFLKCDQRTLGRLRQVCKRLYDIAGDSFLWLSLSRNVLAANQITDTIKSRSCHMLTAREKCEVSSRWKHYRYRETFILKHRTRYLPWLQLQSDLLLLSQGNKILGFPHTQSGVRSGRPVLTLRGHTDDICKFVYRGGIIASGGRDRCLCGWESSTGRFLFCKRSCHSSDVNCVDLHEHLLISGSRDKTVRAWNILDPGSRPVMDVSLGDRVWSAAVDPGGAFFCAGTAAHHPVPPIHLFDLSRFQPLKTMGGLLKNGAGALDLHWESPQTLLSCGYDTYIRLWDTRTGECVISWDDPHDSAVYSMATDGLYTIVSGTARHGLVRLWDKRQAKCLQKFYVHIGHSSPVYSVTFDPLHLFVALDQSVNLLDFSSQSRLVLQLPDNHTSMTSEL